MKYCNYKMSDLDYYCFFFCNIKWSDYLQMPVTHSMCSLPCSLTPKVVFFYHGIFAENFSENKIVWGKCKNSTQNFWSLNAFGIHTKNILKEKRKRKNIIWEWYHVFCTQINYAFMFNNHGEIFNQNTELH